MTDTEQILAAIAQGAQQQVNLQRSVDRIANEQVAVRQEMVDMKTEILAIGGRVTNLESARKYSDRVRSNLSDADMKHESDLAAVVTALESTRSEVAEVKGQQFALMAMNQKQTSVLDLLRGSKFQRLIKETTRLVILLAAVVSAYLSAKGHK